MTKQILIIGGGVGGLAAAIRLAASGHHVTLVEKNGRVGGKLNLWIAPHPARPAEEPFRFDTGPSLFTLPFIFEDLFQSAGERLENHLKLIRLDPIARFCWPDGTTFELKSDGDALEQEVRRLSPGDVPGWKKLAARGRKIWDLTADLFLFHAPGQAMSGKGFSPAVAARLLATPFRIGMFSRYSSLINQHLQHPKLREVMYQYATYSGASPFKAPATLAVIPHAEMHFGGWYIQGGLYRLAEALQAVAAKLGVMIRTNTSVERILIEGKSAVGARLSDGGEIRADAIVANSDVVYTYRKLIDEKYRPHFKTEKLDRLDPGGSGMVILLGVEGHYPQLAHHTKFMPNDYRDDLVAMFGHRMLPDDPCIYVCASTRSDPTQAPSGCENLFILASAPALDGRVDWQSQGRKYRDRLITTLQDRWGLADLQKRIVVQRVITPLDLQSLYSANAGSIYGIGSNSRRSAFLRPPNRDRKIRNLYFAGGATHPGGGLPLVALSGKIVADLIQEDL